MSQRRERLEFTDEFKQQVVSLYNNWKGRSKIIKEYVDCWQIKLLIVWLLFINKGKTFRLDHYY